MAPYIDDMESPEPPTRQQPAPGPAAGGDELDDLFDYEVGLDDVFRDSVPARAAPAKDTTQKGKNGIGLGIDEEVEVTRKARVPRVKLDEDRLLSQAGIPKLRKRAKDLKLKGKGHEYSDAARLLQFYQLWLDDLFPKARFLDALDMVEKLGHKRRIQSVRMDWINEGKPRDLVQEDSIFDDPVVEPRQNSEKDPIIARTAPVFTRTNDKKAKSMTTNAELDDDIYDATPAPPRPQVTEQSHPGEGTIASIFGPSRTATDEEPEADMDDLDALLAEQEMAESVRLGGENTLPINRVTEPDFDDEMEAMAEMEGIW